MRSDGLRSDGSKSNWPSSNPAFPRNLGLLTACQLLSVSGTVLVMTVGGIIGTALAPTAALATLPISIMVVGTAAATLFAAMLMARVGRRLGFIIGAVIALVGAGIAALALLRGEFVLFCLGIGLVGVNGAFVQQYRFAAAESVARERAANAVSIILLGSVGGALLGPWLATLGLGASEHPAPSDYLPAIGALAALQLCIAGLMTGLEHTELAATPEHERTLARPLSTVVTQPRFLIAVLGGMVGYGTMTLIMTATPLSMHVDHGFSMHDTAWVIRSHVLAMYLPSLMSGALVSGFGAPRLMLAGAVVTAVTVAVGLLGQSVAHYWWAMVLLGVGWNFLYVGATALLMQSYRDSEKFAAQAVNEFSVFGSSALASLLAGSLIHLYGWSLLLLVALPALALVLLGLCWLLLADRAVAQASAAHQ